MSDQQFIQEEQAPLPQQEDPIRKIYDVLHSDERYTKSYEEFKVKYSKKENIDKLYQVLYEDGDYTKSSDDFYGKYFPDLKKKEDGGIASQPESKPLTEISQQELLQLSKERKEAKDYLAEMGKGNMQLQMVGGAGVKTMDSPEKNKRLTEINDRLKSAGYDESIADDIVDLPTGNTFGYDLKEILPLKKSNPERYKNYLSSIKFQGEIANRIEKEKGVKAAKEAVHFMKQAGTADNYDDARSYTKGLVSLAENDPVVTKNIANARALLYGADLPGQKEAISRDARYKGNGGNLNNYQVAAIQFLEDTDPATANMFNRLLSIKKVGEGLDDSKIGYDIKARELERMGKGITLNSLKQQLNDNPNNQVLQARYKELESDYLTEDSRYPAAAQMDAQRTMQEAIGARNSIGKRFVLGIGQDSRDVINWVGDVLASPFVSSEGKALRDLELLGEKEFTSAAQMHQPSDEYVIQPDFVYKFDSDLQKKINEVNASDADFEDKAAQVSRLISGNQDQVHYIANDKAGKANFTAKAILSNTSSVGSQIAGQLMISSLLGGSTNASKLKQLSTLFGTTVATTYDDFYSEAIRNNIKNPSTYATIHSGIEAASELINNDFVMAKRIIGGKGVLGAILDNTTEEVWNNARKTGMWGAIGKTLKAGGINSLQETEEEIASQLAGNVVDNYAFDQDIEFTDGVSETAITTMASMLPLGLIGLPFKYNEATRNRKYAMYELGSRPEKFLQSIENDVKEGVITEREAGERKALIERARKAVDATITQKTDGTPLTDNEKTEYAFNQSVLQTIAEVQKNTPPAIQEQLHFKKEEIERKQVAIISPADVSKNEFNNVVEINSEKNKGNSVDLSDARSGETNSNQPEAERISESLPSTEAEGGFRNELQEATNVTRGVPKSSENVETFAGEKREGLALENHAKNKGIWFDDYGKSRSIPPDASGVESDVYINEDGVDVVKVNSGIHHSSWEDFFNRIRAHNKYFPQTKYDLVGFTKKDGKLAVVLRQPLIKFQRSATKDEIKADMESRGLEYKSHNEVIDKSNGVIFRDLHEENAVIAANGNVVYIDPLIQFEENSPLTKSTEVQAKESFAAKNSWASYSEKYPDASMDEYQQHRVAGYQKEHTPGKSISAAASEVAKKIRSLKTKRDKLQSNLFGIPVAVYDSSLEVIALAIENGGKLADAVIDAIDHIKNSGISNFDEEGFRKQFELIKETPEDREALSPRSKSEIYDDADSSTGKELGIAEKMAKDALKPPKEKKPSFFSKVADFFSNSSEYLDNPYRRITEWQQKVLSMYNLPESKMPLGRVMEQNIRGAAQLEVQDFADNVIMGLNKESLDRLQEYVFVKRVADRLVQQQFDKENNDDDSSRSVGRWTLPMAKALIEKHESAPYGDDFKRRVEYMQDASTNMLERLKEGGLLSKEQVDDIKAKNDFYAPFAVTQELTRSFDNLKLAHTASTILKKVKGIAVKESDLSLADLKDMEAAFIDGKIDSEQFFSGALNLLEGLLNTGIIDQDVYNKELAAISAPEFTIGNIFDKFAAMLFDSYRIAQRNSFMLRMDDLSQLDTAKELSYPVPTLETPVEKGFAVIGYKKKGEKVYLAINEEAAKIINNSNIVSYQPLKASINFLNSFLRTGAITLSMGFQATNLFLDLARNAVSNRYGLFAGKNLVDRALNTVLFGVQYGEALGISLYENLGRPALKAFGVKANHTELYREFMRSKGYNSGMYDNPFVSKREKQIVANFSSVDKIKKVATGLFGIVESIGRSIEQSHKIVSMERGYDVEGIARVGVSRWKNLISAAKTPDDMVTALDNVAYEMQNLAGSPNFQQTSNGLKAMSLVFQFASARVKGAMSDIRRLTNMAGIGGEGIKLTKAERGTLIAQFSAIAAAIIVNSLVNHGNDDDEKELKENVSEFDRNSNIMVKTGSRFDLDDGKGNITSHPDYVKFAARDVPQWIQFGVEGAIEKIKNDDPEAIPLMLKNIFGGLSPVSLEFGTTKKPGAERGETNIVESAISGMTPIFKWPVERAFGRNTRYHTDLVSYKVLRDYNNGKLKPYEVTKASTPKWAIETSKYLYEELGVEWPAIYIDHFENSMTGNTIDNIMNYDEARGIQQRMIRSKSKYPVWESSSNATK